MRQLVLYFVFWFLLLNSIAKADAPLDHIFTNPLQLQNSIAHLLDQTKDVDIDVIVACEGRDFILGSILAYKLQKPLVFYRKAAKLPSNHALVKIENSEGMAMHADALKENQRILLVASGLKGDPDPLPARKLIEETFKAKIVLQLGLSALTSLPKEATFAQPTGVTSQPVDINALKMRVESKIRIVHDWPKAGISFQDISLLFSEPDTYAMIIQHFAAYYAARKADAMFLLESRGFLFAPVAFELGIPIYPVHKPNKLSGRLARIEIVLEYGQDVLEMQVSDRVAERAVLFDDLVATGGTLIGATRLANQCGHKVMEFASLIEIPFLKGREFLQREVQIPLYALIP